MSDVSRAEVRIDGKIIELYAAEGAGCPLVVYHAVRGEGDVLWQACMDAGCPVFSLAVVNGVDWDSDMTPWPVPPVMGEGRPFPGRADDYIPILTETILPAIRGSIPCDPGETVLAGYSLAGLFSLYALYRTDVFSKAVSASGSLWYPGFTDFVKTHSISDAVKAVYLSVGDRECRTKNEVLSKVEDATAETEAVIRSEGVETLFELNPGNHFKDAALRTAKGIKWVLEK